jgi:hypothetical protein
MQYWRCSLTECPETWGRSASASSKAGSSSRRAVVRSMIHIQNSSLRTLVPSRSMRTASAGGSKPASGSG